MVVNSPHLENPTSTPDRLCNKTLMNNFLSSLKTSVGPASNVVNEKMLDEIIKAETDRSVILLEIDKGYGEAINKMFDLANVPPVVAIPISSNGGKTKRKKNKSTMKRRTVKARVKPSVRKHHTHKRKRKNTKKKLK